MAYVKTEEIQDGIFEISFFHEAQNSLPTEILNQLAWAVRDAGQNDAVKVIILKSGGDRTFCAGASFTELIAIHDFDTGEKFFSGFAYYCYATSQASIKLSELAVGIGPFVVGPAVERKVGLSAFSQLTLNATELYTAQWAKEKGLYADVFETIEAMDEMVLVLAQKLVNSNPEALRLLKKVFWQGTDHWDTLLIERAGMSGKLVLSDFTKKALAAFAVKA